MYMCMYALPRQISDQSAVCDPLSCNLATPDSASVDPKSQTTFVIPRKTPMATSHRPKLLEWVCITAAGKEAKAPPPHQHNQRSRCVESGTPTYVLASRHVLFKHYSRQVPRHEVI